MAIKKARLNYHNGTSFDTYHYETQAGQVKVYNASGGEVGNLADIAFNGKTVNAVNTNTLKASGLYRLTNPTGAPFTITADEVYLLDVKAVKNSAGQDLVYQTFIGKSQVYSRIIEGSTVGSWIPLSGSASTASSVSANMGQLSSLTTSAKSNLVSAINELQSEINTNTTNISSSKSSLDSLTTKVNNHNHDSSYIKLSGGNVSGSLSLNNNVALIGKNSSGTTYNLAKVDASNKVVLGSEATNTVIGAKSGSLTMYDGTNNYKIWHEGNDGAGSGLNADTVDSIQASQFARRDAGNTFTSDQTIGEGKSLNIKAVSGSSSAGSLYFRDGDGVQKGRVVANASGDLIMYGGTTTSHRFKSTGEFESTGSHEIISKGKMVKNFFSGSGDAGIGHYYSEGGGFGLYDWKAGELVFVSNRDTQVIQFSKHIKVQGKNLFIQTGAPTAQSTGDVWIDI